MPTAMVALTGATLFFFAAMAAEPAQQQSAAAPKAMSLAEDAVRRFTDLAAKQEPGSVIGSYIVGTLFPLAKEAAERIQKEVDDAQLFGEECSHMMWSADKEAEHMEEILQSDEGDKYKCIAEEHRLHKHEKEMCDGFVSAVRNFADRDDLVFPAVKDRNVEDLSTYFSPTKQADVKSKHDIIKARKTDCDSATADCDEQHGKCQVDEEIIEKFYCSMLYQRDVACAAYRVCYDGAAKKVERVESKMKELEAHTKEHYKKLACFQDGVGNLEMDPARCDHEMIDTLHLDVTYKGVPPAEECVHLMKMRRDYSKIVCSGGEVVWNPSTPAPPKPPAASNHTNHTAVSSPAFKF